MHALFFAIGVIAISLVDWPLRKFFKGQKFDGTKVVESSEASYDPVLGTELWEIAKEFSGVVEPAYGERFTSNDMFSEEFLEQLFPNELSMEEHLKVMEETATNLGIEMKHIDATKLRKKDKGGSDANDGDVIVFPPNVLVSPNFLPFHFIFNLVRQLHDTLVISTFSGLS